MTTTWGVTGSMGNHCVRVAAPRTRPESGWLSAQAQSVELTNPGYQVNTNRTGSQKQVSCMRSSQYRFCGGLAASPPEGNYPDTAIWHGQTLSRTTIVLQKL
ncbi:unnamed protein product [Pleuronectes platessa]|uniref:Uncharacterized protein n=1 Tax=Pleuronectes platessa TaxID=8262 RepID=A0A9N7ZDJ9_PLEPL|nr:unnamed protein product [Pleuronectes platessa]